MKTRLIILLLSIIAFMSVNCNGNAPKSEEKEKEIVEEINPIDTFSYQGYNTVAKILAGKTPDDTDFLSEIVASQAFESHKASFDKLWAPHKNNLDVITDWSAENINQDDTVFYPFGGPDFNYMDAFFPDCKFCMLIGLEKGGVIPFSDEKSIENATEILNMVNYSVQSNLNWSFFRTKSMRRDLAGYLEGTLPIIMMFISRHDYDIVNVNPVFLNNEGEFEYTDKDNVYSHTLQKDFNESYEVIYKKPEDSIMRKLYYFSMDVSDTVVNKQNFTLMMENYFAGQTTFMKAASYLLHWPEFSFVRDLINTNSNQIVSGPSGMPYRFYDEAFEKDLHGLYKEPIPLFAGFMQLDMKNAFKNEETPKLPFKYDYHQIHYSLIVARKNK